MGLNLLQFASDLAELDQRTPPWVPRLADSLLRLMPMPYAFPFASLELALGASAVGTLSGGTASFMLDAGTRATDVSAAGASAIGVSGGEPISLSNVGAWHVLDTSLGSTMGTSAVGALGGGVVFLFNAYASLLSFRKNQP